MLQVITQYNSKRKVVTVYDEWDVPLDQRIDWRTCTKDDAGKFLQFTDGSGWWTKLVNCSDEAIKTEAGTFRREDIVQCSRIKWPGGNYSGVPSGDEHPLVRGYTRREKALSTRFLNGTLNGKRINKRTKVLAIEKLRERADKHGVDEEYIVAHLKEMADNVKGKHAFSALITLARIKGVELNQQQDKKPVRPVGIFQQINNYGTIQDRRRAEVPSLGDVRQMIPATVEDVDMPIIE